MSDTFVHDEGILHVDNYDIEEGIIKEMNAGCHYICASCDQIFF